MKISLPLDSSLKSADFYDTFSIIHYHMSHCSLNLMTSLIMIVGYLRVR
jgi:hypothetical protein